MNVTTKTQELYAFFHLSLIDMERVAASLDKRCQTADTYLQEVLLRDAVVSYARPYSRNRGEINTSLRLGECFILESLKDCHSEIIECRNKLFAHNDLKGQGLQFGPGTSFSVAGYETVHIDHLVAPLRRLALKSHYRLMERMSELNTDGL